MIKNLRVDLRLKLYSPVLLPHLVDVLTLDLRPPPPEPLHLGPHELQLGHQPHHGGGQVLGVEATV